MPSTTEKDVQVELGTLKRIWCQVSQLYTYKRLSVFSNKQCGNFVLCWHNIIFKKCKPLSGCMCLGFLVATNICCEECVWANRTNHSQTILMLCICITVIDWLVGKLVVKLQNLLLIYCLLLACGNILGGLGQ